MELLFVLIYLVLQGSLHQTWIHYHKFPFWNQRQGEREREVLIRHCPHSLSKSKSKYVGTVQLVCVGKWCVCVVCVCVCVCVWVCVCGCGCEDVCKHSLQVFVNCLVCVSVWCVCAVCIYCMCINVCMLFVFYVYLCIAGDLFKKNQPNFPIFKSLH